MFACGAPTRDDDSARRLVAAVLHMTQETPGFGEELKIPGLSLRVGISNGTVVGGLLGLHRPQFGITFTPFSHLAAPPFASALPDLWGDVCNTAARLMQAAPTGTILISAAVHEYVQHECCAEQVFVVLKGKGEQPAWIVNDFDLSSGSKCAIAKMHTVFTPLSYVMKQSAASDEQEDRRKLFSALCSSPLLPPVDAAHVRDYVDPPRNMSATWPFVQLYKSREMESQYAQDMLRDAAVVRLMFGFVFSLVLVVGATAVAISWYHGTNGPRRSPVLFCALTCTLPWAAAFVLSLTPQFSHRAAFFQILQLAAVLAYAAALVVFYWTGVHTFPVPIGILPCFTYIHLLSRTIFFAAFLASSIIFLLTVGLCAEIYRSHMWDAVYYLMLFYVVHVAVHFTMEIRLRKQFALSLCIQQMQRELEEAKEISKGLVRGVVPEEVLQRVSFSCTNIADTVESASCIVFDIVGFTPMCGSISPQKVVAMLAVLFSLVDAVVESNGCARLKTLGDAYVAVANVSRPAENHREVILQTGLDVLQMLHYVNSVIKRYPAVDWPSSSLHVRAGCHTGPVLAGVILMKNLVYDVWGPTLKLSEQLQESAAPNAVHCTAATLAGLSAQFAGELDAQPAGCDANDVADDGSTRLLQTFQVFRRDATAREPLLRRMADGVLARLDARFSARCVGDATSSV
eukprot:TRINITY_DN1553_c0_g1_i2.p1 TRINITY_DN1553_c0_g1~~TRINITY_DN1553_c0_g1_i2.p1  ORF type:complete len:685 (-),score=131.40 TRINITY_DN1553_c0_g1_i2:46-2100(-)